MSNDTNRRQNPLPVAPTLYRSLNVDDKLAFSSNREKLKLIIKMLVGSYLYAEEEFTEDQSVYLYFAMNELNRKVELGMEKKLLPYENTLINMIIRRSLVKKDLPIWLQKNQFFCTPHEYYGTIYDGFKFPKLVYKRRPKRLHQERYIGVGYKDKGTATDESFDGQPSWKSVAAYNQSKEEEITTIEQEKFLKLGNSTETIDLGYSDFSDRPKRAYFHSFETKEGTIKGWKNTSEIAEYETIPEKFWNLVHKKLGTKTTNGRLFI